MLVELGDKVKDTVTGFTGIAVAKTTWLHGCDRIVIQPTTLDKDGKVQENASFDAPQVTVLKKRMVAGSAPSTPARERGGPRDDIAATRRKD